MLTARLGQVENALVWIENDKVSRGYKRTKGKSVNILLRTPVYNFISATLTIFFLSTSNAMAYEEPEYKLIKSTDVYEIRQYEDRLAVKTTK